MRTHGWSSDRAVSGPSDPIGMSGFPMDAVDGAGFNGLLRVNPETRVERYSPSASPGQATACGESSGRETVMPNLGRRKRTALRWVLSLAVSLSPIALGGCDESTRKLTKANYSEIQKGMSVEDAQLILGPPKYKSKIRPRMEWGELIGSGPFVGLEYDAESSKITKLNAERLE